MYSKSFLACAKSLQLCLTLYNPMDCRHQALLSMGFSRQEYWNALLCPSQCPPPRDLPHPGMGPASPALASGFSTTSATWGVWMTINKYMNVKATLMWDVPFVSDFVHVCGYREWYCWPLFFRCFPYTDGIRDKQVWVFEKLLMRGIKWISYTEHWFPCSQ